MPRARVLLDWSDGRHYDARQMPCRVCRTATHMRDGQGRPCHQSCAEQELAAELVAAPRADFTDERGRR